MDRYISIVCLFLSIAAFTQERANIVQQLFPADNEIEGWTMKDSIETFIEDDLFYFINGGADIYLEFGFKQVAHCNYKDVAGSIIHLEIYEMEDSKAAYGIFTLNSSKNGSQITIGEDGILYDYYLHYHKGNYYVRCSTSKKDAQIINAMKNIGAFAANLITQKGKKPSLLLAINIEGFQPTQVKYFEGQIGLNNVFNFGHGSVTGFNEGIAAWMDDKMLFVFGYATDYKCREWFASAKGKMQMSKKFFDYEINEDGFTVKDKTGTFLSFKPYGRFYMALKGYDWDEARPIFEKMKANLDQDNN